MEERGLAVTLRHTTFEMPTDAGGGLGGDVRRSETAEGDSVVVVVHGFKDRGFFSHARETLAEAGHTVELDELGLVIDSVRSGDLPGVDSPERLGLLGHSRGGGQPILAVSEDFGRHLTG